MEASQVAELQPGGRERSAPDRLNLGESTKKNGKAPVVPKELTVTIKPEKKGRGADGAKMNYTKRLALPKGTSRGEKMMHAAGGADRVTKFEYETYFVLFRPCPCPWT